jgi:hypothetical protein
MIVLHGFAVSWLDTTLRILSALGGLIVIVAAYLIVSFSL